MSDEAAITQDDFRDSFSLVLTKNADALDLINQAEADLLMLPQGFVFSLPALHAMLDPEQCLPYGDFRNLLYNSSLNPELSAFDAEVTLCGAIACRSASAVCR